VHQTLLSNDREKVLVQANFVNFEKYGLLIGRNYLEPTNSQINYSTQTVTINGYTFKIWYDHIQADESEATNECLRSSNPEETPLHIQKKEKNLQKIKWKPHLKSD